jgi:hypothetical protein
LAQSSRASTTSTFCVDERLPARFFVPSFPSGRSLIASSRESLEQKETKETKGENQAEDGAVGQVRELSRSVKVCEQLECGSKRSDILLLLSVAASYSRRHPSISDPVSLATVSFPSFPSVRRFSCPVQTIVE